MDEANRAIDAGCDLIVLQDVEAGGHVRGTRGLFSLLADVRETVDVPIIAAGGIATPRAVAMALACGAQAVRVGTRFVATNESGYIETGDFTPKDWAVGVAYARRVSDQFSFGGHIRYVHEFLGETLEGNMDNPNTFRGEMDIFANPMPRPRRRRRLTRSGFRPWLFYCDRRHIWLLFLDCLTA